MPRTPRNANVTTQDNGQTTADNETTRRRTPASLEVLAERLDTAEAEALGRQVKYNGVKSELDRLLANVPNREQIGQLFDRASLLSAKLNDANASYRDALAKHAARVAEIAAEIAPDTGDTESEIEADVNPAANGAVLEPATV